MKLVDDIDEQALLERLIDVAKPTVPPECRHLDYLLSTPFRYGAPYPTGSRFRRAGMTKGVFYASETIEAAAAEMTFHRLLFFADAPHLPWPVNPAEYTAFSVRFATRRGIDLTRPPLARDAATWRAPTKYAPCQDLADAARAASMNIIRYQSVRDPEGGKNLALLACSAFFQPVPPSRQSWHFLFNSAGIRAVCEHPRRHVSFGRDAFAEDPRIAAFDWNRPRT